MVIRIKHGSHMVFYFLGHLMTLSQLQRLYTSFHLRQKDDHERLHKNFEAGCHALTPWIRALPQQLAVPRLLKKFPTISETRGSLPHSRATAACSYPEPCQSSPYHRIPLPEEVVPDVSKKRATFMDLRSGKLRRNVPSKRRRHSAPHLRRQTISTANIFD